MRTKGDGGKAERTGGSSTARGTVMYLGPSVHGIIQSGTSYKNGRPPKAAALAALHPVFLELFVPVDGLARARKELAEPGSRLRGVYEEAVKILER